MQAAEQISREFNVTAFSFDHRFHGNSSKDRHYPAFGGQEVYDVQAAMDYAEQKGLPKPYILQGISLGAMAAQRAGIEDKRVAGLFLLSVPGWPWKAIAVNAYLAAPVAELINKNYGWKVLENGDIRNISQPKDHHPLVCYLMGDKDRYDINATKAVFEHWHNGETGGYDISIHDNPGINKFFFTVKDAIHPDVPGYQVWDWDRFNKVKSEFFNRILK
jgi:pimeloyl-ACP methyl ester carboxylesterase